MTDSKSKSGIGQALDEIITPYAERLAGMLVGSVTDRKDVARAISRMHPLLVAGVHQLVPGIGGFLVGNFLPDPMFGSHQMSDLAKNFILHGIRKTADAFKRGEDVSSEDFANKLEAELRAEKVLVDPLDNVHLLSCARLKSSSIKRSQCAEVGLLEVFDQGLAPAPCCFPALQKKLGKPAAASASKPRKFNSAFDVLGALDENWRKEFNVWLMALQESDLQLALKGLPELDSKEEAIGFLSLDPELRLAALPLLANRNSLEPLKVELKKLGELVLAGGGWVVETINKAWHAAKDGLVEIDGQIAPLADKAEAWAKQMVEAPKPTEEKVGFWCGLGRLLLPF